VKEFGIHTPVLSSAGVFSLRVALRRGSQARSAVHQHPGWSGTFLNHPYCSVVFTCTWSGAGMMARDPRNYYWQLLPQMRSRTQDDNGVENYAERHPSGVVLREGGDSDAEFRLAPVCAPASPATPPHPRGNPQPELQPVRPPVQSFPPQQFRVGALLLVDPASVEHQHPRIDGEPLAFRSRASCSVHGYERSRLRHPYR
jgi:hypothetical protein